MKKKCYLGLVAILLVWATAWAAPEITAEPSDQVAALGETASFIVVANSTNGSELTHEWFRSGDNAVDTPADDVSVGASAMLEITAAGASNEGYYFCAVSDSEGTINSTVVTLGVKRETAHWTLDRADYVGGLYLDSSGEGHNADPNFFGGDVIPFVTGVAESTQEAVDLAADPLASARVEPWAPAFGTGEVTVSAWVKWAGPATWAWQGLVNSRGSAVDPDGDLRNFLWEIQPDNSLSRINISLNILFAPALPIGEWVHVAFAASEESLTIWMNGLPVATQTPGVPAPQNVVHMYVGALSRSATAPENTFYGVMDEVRIFNYAMQTTELVDLLYEPVTDAGACIDPTLIVFDTAGGGPAGDQPDCKIGVEDFAGMAQAWLECGLYPPAACQ